MSIEQNIENLEIRNANVVTFVGTSSTMVDTISGRIQCKGFQHNSNVITDVSGPHGRGAAVLKKYPEIAFESGKYDITEIVAGSDQYWNGPSTVFQGGYSLKTTQYSTDGGGLYGWMAFDGNPESFWKNAEDYDASGNYDYGYTNIQQRLTDTNSTNHDGDHVIMGSPDTLKMANVTVTCKNSSRRVVNYSILGSNSSGTTGWTLLDSGTFLPQDVNTATISSPTSYFKYHAFVVRSVTASGTRFQINSIDFYGYEEDPPAGDHSVDTTIKSRFNNPQLTGVQVFVDGKGSGSNQIAGGPVVTDTVESYDETGKYWNLTGELTSNISVEANTFLEGDQPHTVSVWFNSSNLEANVSNTCVFSIASEEKLDSVNLDLQSNTWHNLTYAYQGEGGSRVTYLDGRKVAEDQAEDTFGDYPPFAMTGYSQDGYVASASSEYNTTDWLSYNAFSNGVNHWYSEDPNAGSVPNYYDGGNGVYTGPANLGTDTGGYTTIPGGEWIRLEMPHKLKLSYVNLECPNNRNEFLGEFYVYGSNDDKHWDQLYLAAFPQFVDAGGSVNHSVNAMNAYKYLAIVATRSHVDSGANYVRTGYVGIGEIKFYGHRENDLVRLPDPTNVLKYPHINSGISTVSAVSYPAVSGISGLFGVHSIRGYVFKASSSIASYPVSSAFNGDTSSTTGSRWASGSSTYGTGGVYPNTGLAANKIRTLSSDLGGPAEGATGGTVKGEWLYIEMPHKVKATSMKIVSHPYVGEQPKNIIIYGSNDLTTGWTIVDNTYVSTSIAVPLNTTGKTWTVSTASNPVAYKYFALVTTKTDYTGGVFGLVVINDWSIYGTGVDSIPIQIGGGNIDKVANFRVYDKFVGEDQALEIWNAQKEEFGRAKPQMVLQQGKLGIGTDAPQGSLSVADEPHNMEEFPPRGMTDYKTYFEGHGEFCVSASSENSTARVAWKAFDKLFDVSTGDATWSTASGSNYNGTDNTYNPAVDTPPLHLGTGAVYGDWIKLELPYKINLEYMKLNTRAPNDLSRLPEDFKVYGSNDGSKWTELISVIGRPRVFETTHNTNIDSMYRYFGVVVTKISGQNNYFRILEIRYFGTREQGQSVLHNGQLTLTKNLTVPRIGPALDADNTPRRDRLVVEYNTSTNPTFGGAVRDTSGRGLDGILVGSSYNANVKAFTFSSGDQYINTTLPIPENGNFIHSMSMWFNPRTLEAADGDALVFIGDNTNNNKVELFIETDRINFLFGGNSYEAYPTIVNGKWHHIVVTYNGIGGASGREIYLDGDKLSGTHTGSTGVLNLAHGNLDIGRYTPDGAATDNDHFEGSISNFKLWNVALTIEEAKTLYDMGRCDEGHHVVNFSKTRVGIGLGDGEAPHDELDVRGNVRGSDNVIIGPYSGHWWRLYTFQHNGNLGFLGEDGTEHGYLADSGTVNNIDFTGQHRSIIDKINVSDYESLEGLIVSANKNKYINVDKDITTGSNAIQISQSLPVVSLSNVVHDKACYGVISGSEDPESRTYEQGAFVSIFQKQKGDTRAFINSVGEGAIWVVNTNGSLESGDYITTSNVAGYGQKQNSEFLANYTVAKITMDCDFEPATQPVQQILRSNVVQTYYLGDVHHVKSVPYEIITTEEGESNVIYDTKYTLTTTANVTESDPWDNVFIDPPEVTYATYSNLEANVQSTYTLTFTQTTTDEKTPTEWSALESNVQSLYNKVYYQSVEQEVAADYPGAVAHTRVTDQIENTLDEYGQIQWEDHPTETEKAYKVRYLTADGTQTDEANAVHIAAFVGCTYHCG